MKKLLLLFLLSISTIFAQFGNPKIVALEKKYDFGNIVEGQILKHDFIIYNNGNDTLTISNVRASCGCTAAKPTKDKLLPEDSTTIRVEFNSTRRKGKQRKFVYIFSNDPENPQLRLVFYANVFTKDNPDGSKKANIKLSKYNHNFGNVKEGEILDLKVDIINTGTANLKISRVKSSCGCTAALLTSKIIEPNKNAELKIEFDTKHLSGQVARTVTLYSNDPEQPTRVLTLIANIEKG